MESSVKKPISQASWAYAVRSLKAFHRLSEVWDKRIRVASMIGIICMKSKD